ncbi:uncharacterized protein CTRU02_202594 [Colletotrichum truncatum]|uniref:Uncharacterized protein n=1 Tax=Colletotrichum truncatum TaxID=5467 RepID=A0ACC3ZL84_COLTU|nr:uncharacterized protein CTRU02_01763 [Colletotrichum truncatum]KAF6800084.1 hypothetical protein CTRU02_01763 [Colletotrichum truncatum]
MVTTRAGDHADGAADTNGKTDAPSAAEKHTIDQDAANASPNAKRAKKSDDNTRQTTLEESLEKNDDRDLKKTETQEGEPGANDTEMKDSEEKGAKEESVEDSKTETEKKSNGNTAEIPHEDKKVPSNILEKGIIYFFFRARVNTDQPEEVDDIARSYIMLRPIGVDSKLGDGPIGDAGNTRLLALPKKVLPESGRDRFMVFVEKSGASFTELKEQFLSGTENETKSGTSHVPAATPAGEGVYVITTTGRETHLAYMLTLPSTLGEVQEDLGLKEQGSFILSTKNPKFPGPANARLPEGPEFSEKIQEEFRDLRWMPSKPEHLDFPNAQILLIGESSGLKKATEPRKKDIKEGNEEPKDVLEEIEDEDTQRMQNLADDDSSAIFADLQARAKDYPKLQTTF